jgi:formyltetrahydrofolate deformylase
MDHPLRRPTGSIKIVLPERRSGDSGVVENMIEAEIPSAGHRVDKAGATEVTLLLDSRHATLFVSCRNDHGIPTGVAQVLSANGVRVIDSEQYTGSETSHLFQRIHGDITRLPKGAPTLVRSLQILTRELGLSFSCHETTRRKRVALFVTKHDHCLYDLLLRHRGGELDCDIPIIISNRPDLKPVADQFGVPFRVVPKSTDNKPEAEHVERAILEEHDIDLVVLARYMQILGPSFVGAWERRIINIHHSFLPAFIGGHPYQQAHRRGVKLIGATAHYATATLDEGPIIEQDVVRCTHKDTVEDLTRKGRDLEKTVLARAVRWHLEDRVLVYANKTIVFT